VKSVDRNQRIVNSGLISVSSRGKQIANIQKCKLMGGNVSSFLQERSALGGEISIRTDPTTSQRQVSIGKYKAILPAT